MYVKIPKRFRKLRNISRGARYIMHSTQTFEPLFLAPMGGLPISRGGRILRMQMASTCSASDIRIPSRSEILVGEKRRRIRKVDRYFCFLFLFFFFVIALSYSPVPRIIGLEDKRTQCRSTNLWKSYEMGAVDRRETMEKYARRWFCSRLRIRDDSQAPR